MGKKNRKRGGGRGRAETTLGVTGTYLAMGSHGTRLSFQSCGTQLPLHCRASPEMDTGVGAAVDPTGGEKLHLTGLITVCFMMS